MKDNKGFTLVEILATITLLLLIATIAIPSFISINKKNSERNASKNAKLIENSAEVYYQMNKNKISNDVASGICLPVQYLLEARLLKISDDTEDLGISFENTYVEIKKSTGNNISYTYRKSRSECVGTNITFKEDEDE